MSVDNVRVAGYRKVEAPVLVDTSLPEVGRPVVLLGVQRGMVQILLKEFDLFEKGLAHVRRGILQSLQSTREIVNFIESA